MHDFEFSELSWELLRKVETTFRDPREDDMKSDPVSTLSTVCESIGIQML